MVNAKTFLEKRYSEDMELEDAIHTALLTLKEGFEGERAGPAGLAGGCGASSAPAEHAHVCGCAWWWGRWLWRGPRRQGCPARPQACLNGLACSV